MKYKKLLIITSAFLLVIICNCMMAGCNNNNSSGDEQQNATIDLPESIPDGELSDDVIATFNEVFAPTVTDSDGNISASEISCFFTSFYDDPSDIDLPEFLRYCPLGVIIDDEEEYHKVKETATFDMPDSISEMPTPVRRFDRQSVDDLLDKYAGITTADLTENTNGRAEMVYVESEDAFYNFTSDFGPGSFVAVLGVKDGNEYTFKDAQNRTLTIEVTDSIIKIKSYKRFDIASGLQVIENEKDGTKAIETDYFSLTLSNSDTWGYELDEYGRITIYSTRARNGEYGGRVMSVEAWDDPAEEPYDTAIPYTKIGVKDGHLIFVTYASDIQYDINDEAAADEYMAIRNEAETIQEGGKSGPLILK